MMNPENKDFVERVIRLGRKVRKTAKEVKRLQARLQKRYDLHLRLSAALDKLQENGPAESERE